MPKKVTFGAIGRDLYLDLPLTNLVLSYRPAGLIGDMIAPIVEVNKQSGAVIEFSQADLLRIEDTKRAPGVEAKRIVVSVSSQVYYANNYALKMGVTIEDRANADAIYASRLFEGRAQILTDHLALDWENRVAALVTSASNVGSSASVSSIWTGSGADPLADINTGIDNVTFATGYRPNSAVMGLKAWNAFRRHSTVRNLIFGLNNGGGYPNTDQVKNLLQLDQVLVGAGFKNTAQEHIGKSMSDIWGPNVLIYYANPNPRQDAPSFMYTYRWVAPGIPNMQVERLPYDPKTKTDDIEVGYYQAEKITGASFGFLIQSCSA